MRTFKKESPLKGGLSQALQDLFIIFITAVRNV